MRGYHVNIDGVRLHLVRHPGPGSEMLLVLGITSPAATWDFVAKRLAETFDVHVLDVRGRGLSDAGDLDYSLDAMRLTWSRSPGGCISRSRSVIPWAGASPFAQRGSIPLRSLR